MPHMPIPATISDAPLVSRSILARAETSEIENVRADGFSDTELLELSSHGYYAEELLDTQMLENSFQGE